MKKWVCPVCGYVHEGDVPPAECPVCHVSGEKFLLQSEEKSWAAEHVVGVGKVFGDDVPEEVRQEIIDGLRANFEGECSEVGMYLASGILAALYRARETGQGDRVVVSLFHSAIWDVSLLLQASQYGAECTKYPLSRRTLPNPLVVCHKTKDNKWLQIAMPQYDRHYPIFMRAIGHPEMADDPRYYPQAALQANIEEFYDFLVATLEQTPLK